MRELATVADLLRAGDGHPVIRWDVGDSVALPAYAVSSPAGTAVAFVGRLGAHPRPGLTLLGSPDGMADLLAAPEVRARLGAGADYVTVPRSAAGLLSPWWEKDGGEWDWMVTTDVPTLRPPDRFTLSDLSVTDLADIMTLLRRDNPRTHARPFETEDHWVGVRDGCGALVAVGSSERTAAGTPYLSGITVAADHRGRRLGTAISAHLTGRAVRECGACALGVFADNAVATGLYEQLGYRTGARWITRWLT